MPNSSACLVALAAFIGAPAAQAPPLPADPTIQADVCSLLKQPGSPGSDETKDEAALNRAADIRERTKWYEIPLGKKIPGTNKKKKAEASGYWGSCRLRPSDIDYVALSADRAFAVKAGGWLAAPLAGGWGDCLYEKTARGWALVACRITAVS